MSVHSSSMSPVIPGGWLTVTFLIMTSLVANVVRCYEDECPPDVNPVQQDGNATQTSSWQPRIIGGHVIIPGQVPFLVSIDGRCAGAIISHQHILTSADCVEDYVFHEIGKYVQPPSFMRVLIGEHNRAKPDGEREVAIVQVKIHPGYKGKVAKHNIALLKTATKMAFKESGYGSVGSIQLRCDPVPDGQLMSVVGWGVSKADAVATSPVPLRLNVRAISQGRCRCIMGKHDIEVSDGTLCAEPFDSGTICHGDSGAPLFQLSERTLELVGIASSFKVPCINGKVPATYTRVSDYLAWIQENQN